MFPAYEWYMHNSVSDRQVAGNCPPWHSFAFLPLWKLAQASQVPDHQSAGCCIVSCGLAANCCKLVPSKAGCSVPKSFSVFEVIFGLWWWAVCEVNHLQICSFSQGLPMTLLMSESKSLFRTVDPLAPCVLLQNLACITTSHLKQILWRVGIESDYWRV